MADMSTTDVSVFKAVIDAQGGTAFPFSVVIATDAKTGAPVKQENWPGMTLRDWFAGQALIGAMRTAAFKAEVHGVTYHEDFAVRLAYRTADAMIAARKAS